MKDIIYIRIDKEYKQKLDMFALIDNRSLNNYIVNLLIKHVEEQETKVVKEYEKYKK